MEARRLVTVALMAAAFVTVLTSSAQARDFNCDASAIRLQVGSAATIEPITANRGAGTCKQVKTQTAAQNGAISGGILLAQTTVPGPNQAEAVGGLGQLSVGLGALTGIPLPTLTAIDAISAVPVTIPGGPLLGLPASIQVDIRPAVHALVNAVTAGDLLDLAGSVATADATCVNGAAQLTGNTKVVSLKVLGQEIPTDAAVKQALTVYNGQQIDPHQLDLSKVVLPAGLSITDPQLGAVLQNAIKPVLDNLQPISLPASLINLSVTPGSQQIASGGLTQQGLGIALSVPVLNATPLNVLNAVVGEARVSTDSVTCTVQTPNGAVAPIASIPNAALSCSSRRLALIDVLDRGRYVSLYGAADKRLAGKRIAIYSRANHRVVARPRVTNAGLFKARAVLPPARYRDTNVARYTATYGSEQSLDLKLHRRMVFTSMRSAHGKVTLRGVVTKPFAKPRDTVVIRQRLTCRKQRIVARVHPDANGAFSVTLKAPKNGDVGVYRATTMVGYPGGYAPDFRTYTLPGLVRFAR